MCKSSLINNWSHVYPSGRLLCPQNGLDIADWIQIIFFAFISIRWSRRGFLFQPYFLLRSWWSRSTGTWWARERGIFRHGSHTGLHLSCYFVDSRFKFRLSRHFRAMQTTLTWTSLLSRIFWRQTVYVILTSIFPLQCNFRRRQHYWLSITQGITDDCCKCRFVFKELRVINMGWYGGSSITSV